MPGWAEPLTLLQLEVVQRRAEGCAVPTDLLARVDAVTDRWDSAVEALYDELMALPGDPRLAAAEPNDLAAIRALRPDGPRELGWSPTDAELLDRMHGAWTARATGCVLGKPVEGMGFDAGRAGIRALLEEHGAWPLQDFFPADERLWCPDSQRHRVAFAEPDDDLHYTLVALGVLEENGAAFTWRDVALWWLRHIPVAWICTAEAQAVLTLQNHSTRGFGGPATAELTRRHRNPYREFIGAQIRSDGWAWAGAGRPELAAELAWRDASWTHERNGIYGEMFMAAMQAAAFVVTDPVELVRIGLSEIPSQCRLALAVGRLLDRYPFGWEDGVTAVEQDCAAYDPVHTIPNALLCVVALLTGGLDADRTLCLAVQAGMDTDCNGATTGSVIGALRGYADLGSGLAGRLNDTMRTSLAGMPELRLHDLARRSAEVWKRVRAERPPGR